MINKLVTLLLITSLGFTMAAFAPSALPLKGEAPAWKIDAVHSSVNFNVRHFFTPIDGTFDKFDGVIKFDPDHLHASSASFIIEVPSVNTKQAKRDGHLQSADFFDAEKYPTMKFSSTAITKNPDGGYLAVGRLTIKDVTKQVSIPFQFLGAKENPFKPGNMVGGISAEFKINRGDYGVGSGDWASNAVVGDEVSVKINLELGRAS